MPFSVISEFIFSRISLRWLYLLLIYFSITNFSLPIMSMLSLCLWTSIYSYLFFCLKSSLIFFQWSVSSSFFLVELYCPSSISLSYCIWYCSSLLFYSCCSLYFVSAAARYFNRLAYKISSSYLFLNSNICIMYVLLFYLLLRAVIVV